MVKMKKDIQNYSVKQIEEEPGRLSAQIVFNELVENEMFFWVIGNTQGNMLYTVVLNNENKSIVGFTSEHILMSYINRASVKKTLLNSFGKKIVVVNMSFKYLKKILKSGVRTVEYVGGSAPMPINTVIMNPNSKDFFVPFNVSYFSDVMEGNVEDIERDVYEITTSYLEFDKEIRLFVDNEADDDGLPSFSED